MEVQGIVTDPINKTVIPYATIEAWLGTTLLASGIANESGAFIVYPPGTPDKIKISSASYITGEFKYPGASFGGQYDLFPNVATGEEVVIVSPKPKQKKPSSIFLIIAAASAVYFLTKKR